MLNFSVAQPRNDGVALVIKTKVSKESTAPSTTWHPSMGEVSPTQEKFPILSLSVLKDFESIRHPHQTKTANWEPEATVNYT